MIRFTRPGFLALGFLLGVLLFSTGVLYSGIANAAECFTAEDGNAVMEKIGASQLYRTKDKAAIAVLVDLIGLELKDIDDASLYLAPNGQQVGIVLYAKGCAVKGDGTPAVNREEVRLYVVPVQIGVQIADLLRSVEQRSKV